MSAAEAMTVPAETWGSLLRAAFHRPERPIYRVVQVAVGVLIAVSVLLFFIDFLAPPGYPGEAWLEEVDRLILWLFAIEIGLRILTFHPPSLDVFTHSPVRRLAIEIRDRLLYCLRPLNMIDILTVAALVPALRGLRALRLLRLIRTSKVFRYADPFEGLSRAFRENSLLFALAFTFLSTSVLVGGLSIFLIEGGRNGSNPAIAHTWDGIWWALVTITTVGFGDVTPLSPLGRVVGGVLMVLGMFTLAFFAGVVGNSLVKSVLAVREEQFRMGGYYDHVIICGLDAGGQMLLDTCLEELDVKARPIVVFGDSDRPPWLPPDFVWVSGDPTKESELGKVRMMRAAAVIIVGSRGFLPQQADATTILTIFTVRAFLRRQEMRLKRRKPLYVVAEILDEENVEHAYAAGADEVIETNRLGFSLLAHAVAMPGTAAIMSRVASSGANSVFLGSVPTLDPQPRRFGELRRAVKSSYDALVIGVRNPETNEDKLNPPDDYEIDAALRLIYLAETPSLPEA